MSTAQLSSSTASRNREFCDTLWTTVNKAGLGSPDSERALEELCNLYWYPIYAFLRRWGHDREEARDFTQGFFAYLLEHSIIRRADPERGRFRSFLLGILKNYVSNQRNWAKAIKRGGQHKLLSIDEETADGLYANEPITNVTPDALFDRRWAVAVLEHAIGRLRLEYSENAALPLFDALLPWLTGEDETAYASLAASIGKTENNARQIVSRFKKRFGYLVRDVIAETVIDPDQVEVELKYLQQALRAE